jgi:hypothetical protein
MAENPTKSLWGLFFGPVTDDQIQRAYRVRVVLFFVLVLILIVALFLFYQLSHALHELYLTESERDHWQRPDLALTTESLVKSRYSNAKLPPR